MPLQLPNSPNEPSHRMDITLGVDDFEFRFTWRTRMSSWYFDLFDASGALLLGGCRVSTSWAPIQLYHLENGPNGTLYISGPDDYLQGDIGDSVNVRFYEEDEITIPDADDAVIIT